MDFGAIQISAAEARLREQMRLYPDEDACREHLTQLRWRAGARCPVCKSTEVTWLAKQGVWKCYSTHARARFSVRTGTMLEASPVPLRKWLAVIWLVAADEDNISSHDLAKMLGLSQKSAWFMLHRVRLAMRSRGYHHGLTPPCDASFEEKLRRLLRVRKEELDAMVLELRAASDRFGNPKAPGRKPARSESGYD